MFASQFSPYFLLLPVLFCGGGMALCMWLMSRGSHNNSMEAKEGAHGLDQNTRIAALEAEVHRLHDAERKLNDRSVRSDDA